MDSVPELAKKLEEALMSGGKAKLGEMFRQEDSTGYIDQLDAAAQEMRTHMIEHAQGGEENLHKGELEDIPPWLRRKLLENLAAWNLGRIKTCPHNPKVDAPQPTFMAAWAPRTVTCVKCAANILCPDCGTPEDVLCDGCGMPLTNHKCQGTHALVYGPSTLLYGVCDGCAQNIYASTGSKS